MALNKSWWTKAPRWPKTCSLSSKRNTPKLAPSSSKGSSNNSNNSITSNTAVAAIMDLRDKAGLVSISSSREEHTEALTVNSSRRMVLVLRRHFPLVKRLLHHRHRLQTELRERVKVVATFRRNRRVARRRLNSGPRTGIHSIRRLKLITRSTTRKRINSLRHQRRPVAPLLRLLHLLLGPVTVGSSRGAKVLTARCLPLLGCDAEPREKN